MALRSTAGVATLIVAFFGLLNWQAFAVIVACVALVISVIALLRGERRETRDAAWKADQLRRAQLQGSALANDLRED